MFWKLEIEMEQFLRGLKEICWKIQNQYGIVSTVVEQAWYFHHKVLYMKPLAPASTK